MIFVVETGGQIKECNALSRKTFGYSKGEMLAGNIEALFKPEADYTWGKIAGSVEKKSQWRGDLFAVCKDGRQFPVEMTVSKNVDRADRHVNMICFLRDMTKEKEIDRMKSDFISMASHEMRTPMTSIKNAIDLILKRKAGDVTEAQAKFLSMADRNINRLSSLINNLLDLSKIEAGKMALNCGEMGIRDCIENAMNTLKSLAEEKNILLTADASPGLPPVYADASRIEEVLINLVGNAIKFTPDNGLITVVAGVVEEAPAKMSQNSPCFLEVSVTDNGIGIPEELLGHIFDKFYQVKSSSSGQTQLGTGLGLAISKGIVEGHGGKILCKSKQGKGSTFNFTIPIVDEETRFCNRLNDEINKAKREKN